MDTEILRKLIVMKEDRMSAISHEISIVTQQVRDLTSKIEGLKHDLQSLETTRQEISTEKSMLLQAIGDHSTALPDVPSMKNFQNGNFVVKIVDPNTGLESPCNLSMFDLSDGEPKVRQHTIDVRRYAVMITVRSGPRSTSELIEEFEMLGFRVSDENEVANLSAILSRTSFFRSEGRRWHLDITKLLRAPRRMPGVQP